MNNKLTYINQYNKNSYKMFQFRVKKSNNDLIQFLDKCDNRNSYILELIQKDVFKTVLSIKTIKQKILPIMSKHNIKDVYLFGSYSRGEATSNSDVDIYCDSGDVKTLLDQVSLIEELEIALNKKVDLIFTTSTMSSVFKENLERDLIKLC